MTDVSPRSVPLSVLIPTKNEEGGIADCLRSVAWAEDVVVFDSLSDDATRDIAEKEGARVVTRPFDDFATHKNWALENIAFRHRWVLILDADERVPPALRDEILRILEDPGDCTGFYIKRKNYFQSTWLRFAGMYPDWNMRLFLRDKGRYENRIVHEHVVLEGKAGYLENALVHHDYRGLERFIERHNAYSSMEAVEIYRTLLGQQIEGQVRPDLCTLGPARRRWLKRLAYHLPGRPLLVFLWMYVFRLGFLLGRAGFRYAMLAMFYQYQINLKLDELRDPDSPMRRKYGKYLE
jgi:glycosyltransferase involved in cell wall biosynthesis